MLFNRLSSAEAPDGFPIKIAAIEKRKRAGDDGKKEKACHARFIFLSPGLPSAATQKAYVEETVF